MRHESSVALFDDLELNEDEDEDEGEGNDDASSTGGGGVVEVGSSKSTGGRMARRKSAKNTKAAPRPSASADRGGDGPAWITPEANLVEAPMHVSARKREKRKRKTKSRRQIELLDTFAMLPCPPKLCLERKYYEQLFERTDEDNLGRCCRCVRALTMDITTLLDDTLKDHADIVRLHGSVVRRTSWLLMLLHADEYQEVCVFRGDQKTLVCDKHLRLHMGYCWLTFGMISRKLFNA
jgi:hypothetical protein